MYDECTAQHALITSSTNVIYRLTSEHEFAQGLFTDSNSRLAQKPELINYFQEPRIVNPEKDILKWWKTNQKLLYFCQESPEIIWLNSWFKLDFELK